MAVSRSEIREITENKFIYIIGSIFQLLAIFFFNNRFETIFNMATMKPFWNRSTFLVITGASRGIGKGLAIKFSTLVTSDSTLVLLARSLEDLEATKTQILATNPNLDVKVFFPALLREDLRSLSFE